MYNKGSEIVGVVGNVGNVSEEVRSKVRAMTTTVSIKDRAFIIMDSL